MAEGKSGIVPEPSPQDLNRQLRDIYFAVPPRRSSEFPIGSPENFLEGLQKREEVKRRMGSGYALREIMKRKLSSLLERTATTPSFQSYMVTLYDSLWGSVVGRKIKPEQTEMPNVMSPTVRTFVTALDLFHLNSPGLFDSQRAAVLEEAVLTQAEERLKRLETLEAEEIDKRVLSGAEYYEGEKNHLRELCPVWLAEFVQFHFKSEEST